MEVDLMISTRGRYALRVMIDLAENNTGEYIPLKDIAERQEISKKYLEIIVKDMVTGGLIVGASGKGGGYKLVKKPEKYTVGEILELMEGTLNSVVCLADKNYICTRRKQCKTLPIWKEFDDIVHDYFYGKKLTDLL
jgi:Rrf2 family protein